MTAPVRRGVFTQSERLLLLDLVEERRDVIENRKTDAESTRAKEGAWFELTDEFNLRNASQGMGPKTAKQLRTCYKNLGRVARLQHAAATEQAQLTDDGAPLVWWEVKDSTDTQSSFTLDMECSGSVNDEGLASAVASTVSPPLPSQTTPALRPIRPAIKPATTLYAFPVSNHTASNNTGSNLTGSKHTGSGKTRSDKTDSEHTTSDQGQSVSATGSLKRPNSSHEDALRGLEVLERTVRIEHLKRMNALELKEKEMKVAHKERMQELKLRLTQGQLDIQQAKFNNLTNN